MITRAIEFTLEGVFGRLGRLAVTFFVAHALFFAGSAQANGHEMSADERQAIEDTYKLCINSRIGKNDLKEIENFRNALSQKVPNLPLVDGQFSAEGRMALAEVADQVLPLDIHPKMEPRYRMVIAERILQGLVAQTITERNAVFRKYMSMVYSSMLDQRTVNMDEFKRTHDQLVVEFINFDLNQSDRSLGLTVPLAMVMKKPERLVPLAHALNLLSEQVSAVQVENAVISRDIVRMKKALALQVGYSILGTAAFTSTFFFGGAIVAKGGAIALNLGIKAVLGSTAVKTGSIALTLNTAQVAGQTSGSMLVGALGSGGLSLATDSVRAMSSALMKTHQYGTPFSCEYDRAYALSHPGGALKEGIAMGVVAGAAGTLISNSAKFSRSLILLSAVLITGGLSYEGGYAAYDIYKMIELAKLAHTVKNLKGVPASLQNEHAAIIESIWSEYYATIADLQEHGIKFAAIAALFYYWFPRGEFREALKEGIEKAKMLMAPSADTIPSVVISVGGAVPSLTTAVQNAMKGSSAIARSGALGQAQTFINRVNLMTQSGVAAAQPFEWQIVSPK